MGGHDGRGSLVARAESVESVDQDEGAVHAALGTGPAPLAHRPALGQSVRKGREGSPDDSREGLDDS